MFVSGSLSYKHAFGFSLNVILVHLCVLCFLDLNSREQETCQPVHVINVDIQDNHEEATLGAFLICELCQCVSIISCASQTLPSSPAI